MPPSQSSSDTTDECALPVLDSNDDVVLFDIQSAESGAFTKPAAVDLETYEPGSMVHASWVYFKGDPQEQSDTNLPFERPFDDFAKFSIDLVKDGDSSKVLREIMSPAKSSVFWSHSMPFTAPGNHSVNLYSNLDKSCKYYSFGTLGYSWVVPEGMDQDSVFRLKLTTDDSPTTHLSGRIRLAPAGAAPLPPIEPTPMKDIGNVGVSRVNVAVVTLAIIASMLLACLVALRLHRRSKQIILG